MQPRRLARLAFALILVASTVAVAQDSGEVTRDAIEVPHVSTVPGNRGERVALSVHRYAGADAASIVVTVSPDPLPVVAALGLPGPTYDHLAFWASEGFDVFAADVTGYGLSPRPRMRDGCNAVQETQTSLLTPYPLYIPCEGGYSRLLTSLETDADELERIMEFVAEQTGRQSAAFIGWGVGAARAAYYAANFPDRVDRLVLVAPVYVPDAPDEIPSPYPDGHPLLAHDVEADVLGAWEEMSTCDGFASPEEIADSLTDETNRLDPLAAGWGLDPGNVFRSPGIVGTHGWNRSVAQELDVPTLIVQGELDTRSEGAEALYEDLGSDAKLRLDVACGSHWLMWEATRESIRSAIADFLSTGEVDGRVEGVLRMDREGRIE